MFIALIVLSLVSTVGSSIRSVSLSRSRLPFLSKGRLELTLNGISRFQWVFSSKQWYLAGDISSNKGSSTLSSSKALRSLTRRIFRFLLVRFNSQAVHRGFVAFSRLQLERYFSLTIYVFFVSADILTFIILYNNLIPISFVQSLFLLLSLVSLFFRPLTLPYAYLQAHRHHGSRQVPTSSIYQLGSRYVRSSLVPPSSSPPSSKLTWFCSLSLAPQVSR